MPVPQLMNEGAGSRRQQEWCLYPEGEPDGPVVGLEADGAALLQDGLVGGVQSLAHHRGGAIVVVVTGLLVSIVLILLLVSQEVGVQVPVQQREVNLKNFAQTNKQNNYDDTDIHNSSKAQDRKD